MANHIMPPHGCQHDQQLICVRSPSIAAIRSVNRTSQPDHIGNLPIEIFTDIVKIVIKDSNTTSMTISQVSKPWRSVMHNIPSFWDTLVLTHRSPKTKTQFWMKRSKGRLRELCVRPSAVGSRKTKSWADLLKEVDWSRLRVLRVEKWPVVKFLHNIGMLESLNNLETLEIDSANPLQSFPPSIHNSKQSKLQNLIILSTPPSRFQTTLLQVRDLTSLSLSNIKRPLECLFTLLNLNPLLEHLSLSRVSYGGSNPSRVTMNHLKSLRLQSFFPWSIFSIDMPNLEVIQIENQGLLSVYDSGLYRYSMDAMRSSLGHTRLSKIILRQCETIGPFLNTGDSGLISLLQHSPNLQQFEISHTPTFQVNFVTELLASTYSPPWALKPTTDEVPICPNLTHIDFSGCPRLETGPVLRMVKSRIATQIITPTKCVEGQGEDSTPPIPSSKEIVSLILDSCPQIDPGWVGWLKNHVPHVSWKVRI